MKEERKWYGEKLLMRLYLKLKENLTSFHTEKNNFSCLVLLLGAIRPEKNDSTPLKFNFIFQIEIMIFGLAARLNQMICIKLLNF